LYPYLNPSYLLKCQVNRPTHVPSEQTYCACVAARACTHAYAQAQTYEVYPDCPPILSRLHSHHTTSTKPAWAARLLHVCASPTWGNCIAARHPPGAARVGPCSVKSQCPARLLVHGQTLAGLEAAPLRHHRLCVHGPQNVCMDWGAVGSTRL